MFLRLTLTWLRHIKTGHLVGDLFVQADAEKTADAFTSSFVRLHLSGIGSQRGGFIKSSQLTQTIIGFLPAPASA